MKKSLILNLMAFGIIFTTSALASPDSSAPSDVICPTLDSLTCVNTGDNHFYNSISGFPVANWTSNFVPGACPKISPTIGSVTTSTAGTGAEVICTYRTSVETIAIFQTSSPKYCVKKPVLCSPDATLTLQGECVEFNQHTCAG